tara:strand:+ start:3091 stop:3291 length:201 start_codon:yes stop_codon:yes gene_type:complete
MSILFDVIKKVKGKDIEKVTYITHEMRLKECRTCDKLLLTGNCSICGCFVKDKSKYKEESCPQNKW